MPTNGREDRVTGIDLSVCTFQVEEEDRTDGGGGNGGSEEEDGETKEIEEHDDGDEGTEPEDSSLRPPSLHHDEVDIYLTLVSSVRRSKHPRKWVHALGCHTITCFLASFTNGSRPWNYFIGGTVV